jgi:hypothetical protein
MRDEVLSQGELITLHETITPTIKVCEELARQKRYSNRPD